MLQLGALFALLNCPLGQLAHCRSLVLEPALDTYLPALQVVQSVQPLALTIVL
jgi:hypothetical protein